MKKAETKAELRARLERETRRYLDAGGRVEAVPSGVSGRDPDCTSHYPTQRLFSEPKVSRTPIPEVIAAIEQRRQAMRRGSSTSRRGKATRHGRARVIYDDFGEPVRRVWDDS